MPLNNDIYLAPIIPVEILKITGNGKPYFCEGLEIKFANKHTKNAANKEPQRTPRRKWRRGTLGYPPRRVTSGDGGGSRNPKKVTPTQRSKKWMEEGGPEG